MYVIQVGVDDRQTGEFRWLARATPRRPREDSLNAAKPTVECMHTFMHIIEAVDINWDPAKARANVARHGIAFEDAEPVLTDPVGLTREDPDARGEARFVTVGADALGRIVAVVYAYRDDDVRLISARPAARKEKEAYAQGI